MMSISFELEEIVLNKLRERLRRMTDDELIRFGKDLRRLAENPFQRQLEEARREWKQRKGLGKWQWENSLPAALLLSTPPLSRILFPLP
jgi:hypothetical protein